MTSSGVHTMSLFNHSGRLSLSLLSLLLLAGCASNIPRQISETPADNPSVKQVRSNIEPYQSRSVRWGGTIAAVENKENETWIEVVTADLGSTGRPRQSDKSYGRFLARISGFVDPQIYAEDRELTVYGTVESRIVRPIGEHPYTYPLIKAESYHLWPEYVANQHNYGGYYGSPYGFYPHYGFYYPYHSRARFHYGFGHRYYW